MDRHAKGILTFHPNSFTGDFVSPLGIKGYFIFYPKPTTLVGAAVTEDEKVGKVERKDDDFFEFTFPGLPTFTLKAERTASGRLPMSSGPTEMCGPMGC